MSAAHTPWTLGLDGENVCMIYSGRSAIAQVFGLPMHTQTDWEGLGHPRWADAVAVGRLMQAAPELLDACEALVRAGDTAPPVDLVHHIAAAISRARAAIAKATTAVESNSVGITKGDEPK